MDALPLQRGIRFLVALAVLAGIGAAKADDAVVYDLASLDAPPLADKHNARPKFPSPKGSAKPPRVIEVDFVVGADGLTHETRAVGERHDDFDAVAVQAVEKWHFKPGLRQGQAVATRIRKEVFIDPDSEGAPAQRMTNIRLKKDDSTTPPPFSLGDHTVFPLAALQSGQSGRVVVQYMIGYGGRARQLAVNESSSPEFALAAMAALESVYFVKADEAKPTLIFQSGTITFTFRPDGTGNVLIRESARRILRMLVDHPQAIVSPSALDAALKLVHPVNPARPDSFSGGKPTIGPLDLSQPSILAAMTPRSPDKKTGEALVEFFVDEDGLAQLPRVVSATEPEFGAAAAQAVSEWRFAPPTQGDKPVIVRAQVPVKFGPG